MLSLGWFDLQKHVFLFGLLGCEEDLVLLFAFVDLTHDLPLLIDPLPSLRIQKINLLALLFNICNQIHVTNIHQLPDRLSDILAQCQPPEGVPFDFIHLVLDIIQNGRLFDDVVCELIPVEKKIPIEIDLIE